MSGLLDALARFVVALGGKKVTALLIALVVWVGGRLGLELPLDVVGGIAGTLVAYILAQGVADAGKERAKVETKAAIEHGVTSARVEVTTLTPPVASSTPAPSLDQMALKLRQDALTARFRPDGSEVK